jgi:hypothetical protein
MKGGLRGLVHNQACLRRGDLGRYPFPGFPFTKPPKRRGRLPRGCRTPRSRTVDQLGVSRRDHLAGCGSDDVDPAERRPANGDGEAPITRPAGDAGVSTISIAAGRNSTWARRATAAGSGSVMTTPLCSADFMETCLKTVQRGIAAIGANEIIVDNIFHDAASFDDDYAFSPADGGKPMRDDEHGTSLSDTAHVILDDPLALIVKRAGRLIEDQNAGIGDECARDSNTLALATRQAGAALSNHGVVALWEFQNEVVGAGQLRSSDNVFGKRSWISQRDVIVDRAVEEDVFLQHDADLTRSQVTSKSRGFL